MTLPGPVYISGPHGAGKTTLLTELLKKTQARNLERGFSSLALEQPHLRVFLTASLYCSDLIAHRAICQNELGIGDRCIIDSFAYLRAFRTLNWLSVEEYEYLRSYIRQIMALIGWPKHVILLNPDAEFIAANIRTRSMVKGWRQDNPELTAALIDSYHHIRANEPDIDTSNWLLPGDYRDAGFLDMCVHYVDALRAVQGATQ